jgi:hypothetical protein
VLVMSYLEPSRYVLWKQALRDGHADAETARAVGRVLARIHAFSAARPRLAAEFPTDAIFFDIRLEPYLLATAAAIRPGAADRGAGAGDAVECGRPGARRRQPEEHPGRGGRTGADRCGVRVVGRPGFDIAFCLNHLLLKCLWTPRAARPSSQASRPCRGPTSRVSTGSPAALEQRAAALLPGLFLARVDGKSPVEYLTDEADRDTVRRVARA